MLSWNVKLPTAAEVDAMFRKGLDNKKLYPGNFLQGGASTPSKLWAEEAGKIHLCRTSMYFSRQARGCLCGAYACSLVRRHLNTSVQRTYSPGTPLINFELIIIQMAEFKSGAEGVAVQQKFCDLRDRNPI